MSWGMVAAAAVTAVAGYANSRSQKKADKQARKDQMAMTAEESRLAKDRAAFDAELDHYYTQLERKERERGLDEFRKFSTVSQFAPEYVNTNPGVVVPNKPQVEAAKPQPQSQFVPMLMHAAGYTPPPRPTDQTVVNQGNPPPQNGPRG